MGDGLGDTYVERLRLERDLYLGLLGLTDRDDPGSFLDEALSLIVKLLDAQQGYLEVSDPAEGPTSWRAAGCSDEQVEVIRTMVSRGVIAETLAREEVINSASALLDPRFRDRASVQAGQIEAVLCVPIIRTTPVGVLYLQGRPGAGPFCDAEVEQTRAFARHLAPLVESLFIRSRQQRQTDHVAPLRKRLLLDGIVGTSAALAAVLHQIELVAPLDVSVLITGDTGTGKSQLARTIHNNGPRRDRPFVLVDCASFHDTLLVSELFGAMPGSFTDAKRRIEGKVAAAQGGTLFLDEAGEMSPAAQSKLLTFLDTRSYCPLGSSKSLSADVRIVAATNADLDGAVRERRFREDLFHRLNVWRIRMPDLSERPQDILPLATSLCEGAVRSYRLSHVTLSPGAMCALQATEWPGNVRQLNNVIEQAAIKASADGSKAVEATHLFPESGRAAAVGQAAALSHLTFQEETRRFQGNLVQRVLEGLDWNVTQAARALDLTRAHLHNLIRAHGLKRRTKAP